MVDNIDGPVSHLFPNAVYDIAEALSGKRGSIGHIDELYGENSLTDRNFAAVNTVLTNMEGEGLVVEIGEDTYKLTESGKEYLEEFSKDDYPQPV